MKQPIHQETLCCGFKRCPTATVFDDGSVELTDDDAENGSEGTIKLSREQLDRLIAIRKDV